MFQNIHQLDYSEEEVGKRSAKSKKEVTFRFVVNSTKEYEVVLKWSFSSGKQTLLVNGEEKSFSENSGASVFDCTVEHDGLQLQLIGCQKPPTTASPNYFRCFELLINGMIFSACPTAGLESTMDDNVESVLDIFYPDYRRDTMTALQNKAPLPALPPSTTLIPDLMMIEPEEEKKDMVVPSTPANNNGPVDLMS